MHLLVNLRSWPSFPDYGLGYKYGGWHLTCMIVVGDGKIYVAVGSSCNACEEKEEVRASILQMDPDGENPHYFARGLRNAVGLALDQWRSSTKTNMGSDHLGDNRPAAHVLYDRRREALRMALLLSGRPRESIRIRNSMLVVKKFDCRKVPHALTPFPAHSSPLGLEYFDANNATDLAGSFLVALHGSTKKRLQRGYRLVRVRESGAMEDFMTGFFEFPKINGRPADVFSVGKDAVSRDGRL